MTPVKINAGYSDKESQNYNSRAFSIGLEMTVNVNGSTQEIEQASARLFDLCKRIIAVQKGANVDGLLNADSPAAPTSLHTPAASTSTPSPHPAGTSTARKASTKQVNYLLELAKKSGMSTNEILSMLTVYNKEGFDQLTSTEASKLIDQLSKKKAA